MRLLLDTHIFLWACITPEKLPAIVAPAIADPNNELLVSAVTAWEIAIKRAAGRLHFPLEQWEVETAQIGVWTLPITHAHGIAAGALPRHHTDPFDRMLVAQAHLEGLTLVTSDRKLRSYNIPLFPPA